LKETDREGKRQFTQEGLRRLKPVRRTLVPLTINVERTEKKETVSSNRK